MIIRIGLLLFSAICLTASGQNSEGNQNDLTRLALSAYVPDQIEGLTPEIKSNLENRLRQIITNQGFSNQFENGRFIMTANISVLSREIVPSVPHIFTYTLEVTLFIGDGVEGTLFASKALILKSAGETETKVYMSALRSLKSYDERYSDFIEKGKRAIIGYYNSKCDFVIAEAKMLADRNEFDAALYKLVSIPTVCKVCYEKAMEEVLPIYIRKINRECKQKLNEAWSIWSANQDYDAANRAGVILSTIEPDAECFHETKLLFEKIEARVREVDGREWQYHLKTQMLKSERIQALRDVGVAVANNLPKTITYNTRGWW